MNKYTQTSRSSVFSKPNKYFANLLVLMMSTLPVHPAFAASRSVTLAISNMTCSACPITVKKALLNVQGVEKVTFNLDRREAAVTFNDKYTSVEALTKATENAGYPSHVAGGQ